MNQLKTIVFGFAAIFVFATSADAQRRTTPAKPKVVTTNTVATSATEVKSASEKVSIQIKNTTKFLYILGGAASGIEQIDKDRNANQAARNANAQNKQDLIRTIQNMRAGMLALEVEFRTKVPLKKHLPLIAGITDLTAQSEDLAVAGRFSDSGRPLLTLVEKLSDALAAM